MSTATIELSSTRRKLFDLLGEQQQAYLDHLKSWFRKRCSKEEFDAAARRLLSPESVHLHNQFLLALLNKCQTLVNISPCPPLAKPDQAPSIPDLLSPSKFDQSDRLKKGKIKRKSKPNRASLEHRFQPVSVANCAPEVALPAAVPPEERAAQFCARESTLPDVSLVHGRLLVGAWEEGLEGVEEGAVKLALAAAEQQLRRIIFSLLKTRNSWRERAGVEHSVGAAAPDPWLLNTQVPGRHNNSLNYRVTLETSLHTGAAESSGAGGGGRPRPHPAQRHVPGAGRQGGGGQGGGRGDVRPRPRQAAGQAHQVRARAQ